jgi:hypothetical protein
MYYADTHMPHPLPPFLHLMFVACLKVVFFFRIYVYKKEKVVKKLEEMFNNYNVALNEKDAKLNILKNLMTEYKKEKEKVLFIMD